MKDLGALKYFLGLEVARGPQRLYLCQRKYTIDIITECGLLGSIPSWFTNGSESQACQNGKLTSSRPGVFSAAYWQTQLPIGYTTEPGIFSAYSNIIRAATA